MLTTVVVLLVIWIAAVSLLSIHSALRVRGIFLGLKKKELRELLEHVSRDLRHQQQTTKGIESSLENLLQQQESHLQRIGFVRFNPFADTGGNQSFCLAILDRHDNGIMISSLHSRDQTRLYAKEIRGGKAQGQELSKEELEALRRAQGR